MAQLAGDVGDEAAVTGPGGADLMA